jgi:hypothetical protein
VRTSHLALAGTEAAAADYRIIRAPAFVRTLASALALPKKC